MTIKSDTARAALARLVGEGGRVGDEGQVILRTLDYLEATIQKLEQQLEAAKRIVPKK